MLHLCRQTRAEIINFYEALEVTIPWHENEAYVRTFFPLRDPVAMAEYRGRLVLDMDHYIPTPGDALPVLKVHLYAPKVQIKTTSYNWLHQGPSAEAMPTLLGDIVIRWYDYHSFTKEAGAMSLATSNTTNAKQRGFWLSQRWPMSLFTRKTTTPPGISRGSRCAQKRIRRRMDDDNQPLNRSRQRLQKIQGGHGIGGYMYDVGQYLD